MSAPITRSYDILEAEYDVYPYQSFPFSQSHPRHLYTLAKLFGIQAEAIESAKVLELGCASGGNLIPMAFHYPHAHFQGIDLSDVQVKAGNQQIDDLQLKNISLRHQSILDFHPSEGKFDYIICHGVYSWVDSEVRDKIFSICRENLNHNGIAYISYNTFPGWNMVNSVRDLMLWHTQHIQDPATKAKHARFILKFITDGLQDNTSPYATFLRSEINLLTTVADSYMLHDHLSSYNDPVYFYQFMDKASQNKLQYLSDTHLATMFAENLPPQFSNELKKINNIIVANQYMDFIRNQRFRSTLLCHRDVTIRRALKTSDIESFYIQLTAKPVKPDFSINDIQGTDPLSFTNGVSTLNVRTPLSKWALYILHENKHHFLSYDELCQKIEEVSGEKNKDTIRKCLNEDINLMRAVLAGLVLISAYPISYLHYTEDFPVACPLAQYQLGKQDFVTNRRHHAIKLDIVGKILLPFMDGKHDLASLEEILIQNIRDGKISILDKDKNNIIDTVKIAEYAKTFCKTAVNEFAKQALLIKPS